MGMNIEISIRTLNKTPQKYLHKKQFLGLSVGKTVCVCVSRVCARVCVCVHGHVVLSESNGRS